MGFDFLQFASPWFLAALAGLPILWWLLKLTPPKAKSLNFGGLYFLQKISNEEKTSNKLPLWLLILRLAIIACLILAFSEPFYKKSNFLQTETTGKTVIVLIDNGWASAQNWTSMKNQASTLIKEAGKNDQQIILKALFDEGEADIGVTPFENALSNLNQITPQVLPESLKDYESLKNELESFTRNSNSVIFYLNDGLSFETENEFIRDLNNSATLKIFDNSEEANILSLHRSAYQGALELTVTNKGIQDSAVSQNLLQFNDDSQLINSQILAINDDEELNRVTLNAESSILRQTTLTTLESQNHAGAKIWNKSNQVEKTIGLLQGKSKEGSDQLEYLSPYFYIEKALAPYHEVIKGELSDVIEKSNVIILANSTDLKENDVEPLRNWINEGGIFIRFADENLATGMFKELSPVNLRITGREFDTAFSWQDPQEIQDYPNNSLFAAYRVPNDIEVKRQILAEPSLDLNDKTLASLEDGTPMITASQEELGWLVLYHIDATPQWSNLPISGHFIEQLNALSQLSTNTVTTNASGDGKRIFRLIQEIGFQGKLNAATQKGLSIELPLANNFEISKETPAGVYENENGQLYNLNFGATASKDIRLSVALPSRLNVMNYTNDKDIEFKPYFLMAGLILLLIDWIYMLSYQGIFRRFTFGALFLLFSLSFNPSQTMAADPVPYTDGIYLAYIKSGDPNIDRLAEAGLTGLMSETIKRTSADLKGVVGINLESDPLYPYPLIYWPLKNSGVNTNYLSNKTSAKLSHYFANGGLLFIDTRDQYLFSSNSDDLIELNYQNNASNRLQTLFNNIDIPPMKKMAKDHVLARSFYLLENYPGLYKNGGLWIAEQSKTINDGVSPLIVGSNDWISAWAVDQNNQPMINVPVGGNYQREISYRFGINLILYALTGNYKEDQIHIPFILERLDN